MKKFFFLFSVCSFFGMLVCIPGSLAAHQAICVPWIPSHSSVPHYTYSGAEITVKGVARGEATEYRWDFGDGNETVWTDISDPYNLGTKHIYIGVVGRKFIATLYVKDVSGNQVQDEYPVKIHESSDLSNPVHLNVRINMAIDEGLWYLHTNMIRDTYAVGSPGYEQPYGYWDPSYYPLAAVGTAVEAFQKHGSKANMDYNSNPYVETVQRALNYLLYHIYSFNINVQPAGDPDTNGNGIGLVANWTSNLTDSRQTYIGGICLIGLANSGAPNRMAAVGGNFVYGRTYAEIVQDMVDFFAWGQVDTCWGTGGWRYYANYDNSDMSTTQWPPQGMLAAEKNMGSIVPQFVRDELQGYLDRVQNQVLDNDNGGFAYYVSYSTPTHYNVTKAAAGIICHEFLGTALTDPVVRKTMGFIYRHWNDNGAGWNYTQLHGNSYGMYSVVKAFRIPDPDIQQVIEYDYNTEVQTAKSFDWYYTPVGQNQEGLASYIVSTQQSDGGWDDIVGPNAVEDALCTGWRVLVLLTGNYSPIADPGGPYEAKPKATVILDGTASFDPDPGDSITYAWDLDNDGEFDDSFDAKPEFTVGPDIGMVYDICLKVTDSFAEYDVVCTTAKIVASPKSPQNCIPIYTYGYKEYSNYGYNPYSYYTSYTSGYGGSFYYNLLGYSCVIPRNFELLFNTAYYIAYFRQPDDLYNYSYNNYFGSSQYLNNCGGYAYNPGTYIYDWH